MPEGEIYRLHHLLANNGYQNYTIEVRMKVSDGHIYPSMQVTFDDKKKEDLLT